MGKGAKVSVNLNLKSEDAAAIQSLLKAARAQDKLAEGTRRVNRAANEQSATFGRVGQSGEQAFGARALGQLKNYAVGFVSVSAAARGVKTVIDDITQALEKNKAAAEGAIGTLSRFSAVSGLSPKDREFVLGQTGRLSAETVGKIGFGARSAGFNKEQIQALLQESRYAAQLGEDPLQYGSSVKSVKQSIFSGKTIPQISGFLTTMAEQSPLSADTFSEHYLRVAGMAGMTEQEKVAAGALVTGVLTGLGAEGRPETASTAARGFLAARKTSAAKFLKKHDLYGLGIPEQLGGLQELAMSEDYTKRHEEDFLKAFGREVGPPLLALLRSPEGMAQIPQDIQRGMAALSATGPSRAEQKVLTKAFRDPQWAMVQERLAVKGEREAAEIARGFRQAPWDLTKEEFALDLEQAGFGATKVGFGKRVVQRGLARGAGTPAGILTAGLGDVAGRLWGGYLGNVGELRAREKAAASTMPTAAPSGRQESLLSEVANTAREQLEVLKELGGRLEALLGRGQSSRGYRDRDAQL